MCKKGQAIIYEGMVMNSLYFIYHGKAKAIAGGMLGKQQIQQLAKTGDVLGFRGMGGTYTFPSSVYAIEDSCICSIDRELFLDVLKANPNLTLEMLMLVTDELRKSELRMKNLSLMNVREKIANSLLYIYEVFGNSANGELDVSLSRQEIAEIAGTTKEQVSKCLSEFEQEGKIKTDRKKIIIPNTKELKRITGEL
ncbi:MAG: Crp/Fnr family transcriptional regulator [Bacteroidetes bacterium]|nr:Crp/Fnr family transcriptional regulator [Bacteroidota bacterium]